MAKVEQKPEVKAADSKGFGVEIEVEHAFLHQAAKIWGSNITERTLSKAKLGNARLIYFPQAHMLGVYAIDKTTKTEVETLIPSPAVQSMTRKLPKF